MEVQNFVQCILFHPVFYSDLLGHVVRDVGEQIESVPLRHVSRDPEDHYSNRHKGMMSNLVECGR